ncbi:DMT family transporter [Gorillibacterium sp. sgz5001074]|uniref:DMT family transporter n=1 Tax=Gorillibacterium sp. sgz5001074 TaxID=3446695 RepID=UPI003F67BE3B
MNIFSILLAFLAGAFGSTQATINTMIGKQASQFNMIAYVSLVQVAISLVFILFRGDFRSLSGPTWGWIGTSALLGVIIMLAVTTSINSIGSLSVYVLLILGQVILSAVVDHFGWFGVPKSPITLQKAGSISIIMIGVVLLVRS